jgi:AcrR family transcriptional regulator
MPTVKKASKATAPRKRDGVPDSAPRKRGGVPDSAPRKRDGVPDSAPRKRDAEATRAAILESARAAFVRSGYDGAGVREIAAGAGVTAMMVNRYFGSKEELFAEVVANTMRGRTVLNDEMGGRADLAAYIAAGVLETTRPGATPVDGSLIMIRSSSSARAAEIGRREIERGHQKRLAAALKGDHAAERAALILSLIAGVQFMRQMVGLKALVETKPETLHRLLAPVIAQLVEPERKLR